MHFSALTINTKGKETSLEDMSKNVQGAVSAAIPVSYIDYATFKKSTESKPIPLYIMENKNNVRANMMRDVDTMKNAFRAKAKFVDYTAPIDQSFNPRYMVLDVHDIHTDDSNEQFAIRIMMSKRVPISHALLLDHIAASLSTTDVITTVFVVGAEANVSIEYVSRWGNGQLIHKDMGPEGSKIIGKYTNSSNISINKILSIMDDNIDRLMSPKDLVELEAMMRAFQKSREFMEGNRLNETPEYYESVGQIKDTENQIRDCQALLKENPNVISSYIRVYDPRELAKFKVRDINTGQGAQHKEWNQ